MFKLIPISAISTKEIDYVQKALDIANEIRSEPYLHHQCLLRMQYDNRPEGLKNAIGVLLLVSDSLFFFILIYRIKLI